MTPADEASASIKVPGRDFGLKRGQLAEDFKNPGAPLPENSPQARLPEAFQPAKPKATPPVGTADNPFKAPSEPEAPAQAQPIQRGNFPQLLQQQLEKGLDAGPPMNPKVPLKGQLPSMMKSATSASDLPTGHTAVESSAMRSKMYDPAAKEFHARLTSGDTTYVYGDVAPEEAQAFEGAKSKGQAFQAIKQNHPLVAKIVNGKRIAVKAPSTR
jgi:hypothetical protein